MVLESFQCTDADLSELILSQCSFGIRSLVIHLRMSWALPRLPQKNDAPNIFVRVFKEMQ